MARLVIKTLDGNSTPFEISGDQITIGRHTDNVVCLDDLSVSTHHAEIMRQDGKFILRDLNSSNATRIDGQRITEAELHDGNTVRFGAVECVFEDEAQTPAEGTEEHHASVWSKLIGLGRAALHETRRDARAAALKGRLEKLKLVELPQALCALGKKAYERRMVHERFAIEYAEITEMEKAIADLRMARCNTAELQSLEEKHDEMFATLGGAFEELREASGLESEMNALNALRTQIGQLEAKFAALSAEPATEGEGKDG